MCERANVLYRSRACCASGRCCCCSLLFVADRDDVVAVPVLVVATCDADDGAAFVGLGVHCVVAADVVAGVDDVAVVAVVVDVVGGLGAAARGGVGDIDSVVGDSCCCWVWVLPLLLLLLFVLVLLMLRPLCMY